MDSDEVKVAWRALEGSQQGFLNSPYRETLLHGSRGGGKQQPLDTDIVTPNGYIKLKNLSVGDLVSTPNGKTARVKYLNPIHYDRDVIEFTFDDGTKARSDREHLWYGTKRLDVYDCLSSWSNKKCINTTQEIMDWHDGQQKLNKPRRYGIPIAEAVYMDESEQPVDPYLLGALIGDGCLTGDNRIKITSHKDDIDHFIEAFSNAGYTCSKQFVKENTFDAIVYPRDDVGSLIDDLRSLELYGHCGESKFIPSQYKVASVEQREALLQGLMDTDGGVETNGSKSRSSYWTISEKLAEDVLWVARSLGYKATLTKRPPRDKIEKDGRVYHCNPCFVVRMAGRDDSKLFRLERKKNLCKKRHSRLTKNLVSYTVLDPEPMRCIMLDDEDHLYLFDDFTVTHNTETAVMAYAMHVGKGYGERWKGLILRRQYKDLEDVISKSKRLFRDLFPDAKFYSGKGDLKWVWPTGESLLFRKFNTIDDYSGFHGQEFPFILWEELTNWPTDECYNTMKSCNRSADTYSTDGKDKMPLKYLSTTNPSGAGHSWVKNHFKIGDAEEYSAIINEVGEARTHIASSVFENPYMDDNYVKDLFMIKDENLKKAWLYGRWDIVAGGMFTEVWSEKHNIVRPFEIPESWKISRSFDWGSSKPFSVIWYAESDGTDYIDADGNEVATVRGDLFAILEYYGASAPNVGLRMTARDVAINIRDYEMNHPLLKGRNVRKGPADTAIWTTENGNSIQKDMARVGIYWIKANKRSGSRHQGWEAIRTMLHNAHNRSGLPALRIFGGEHCSDLLRLLPVAPRDERDPDDIDTNSEDHNLDSLRYKVFKPRASNTSRQL